MIGNLLPLTVLNGEKPYIMDLSFLKSIGLNNCNVKRALRKGDLDSLPASVSRELSCDVCGKLALSKAGLASHKRSHVNAALPPQTTTCNQCGKVCKSSGGLKRHMKIHL